MKILVGSTIPLFKMTDDGHWWHWLENAEAITEAAQADGHEVGWLAVLQHDARGPRRFQALLNRLHDMRLNGLQAEHWLFSIDDREETISSGSRLAAICTGRNLITECALRNRHDAIYFADSDIEAPDDILPKLLEVEWPVVGAHVPTYCLDGPYAAKWAREHFPERRGVAYHELDDDPIEIAGSVGDVRVHWNTAGSLLIRRGAFRRVPWRWDPDAGNTDDPATQAELERQGWPTLVRHDVICHHHPGAIGGLESRGHDLAVYR